MAPHPPRIPTGQELYDAIMGHIEPELTTASAQALATKYQGESAAEHESRMSRYEIAFAQYERAYTEYVETLQAQVGRYKKDALNHAELADRTRDEGRLGSFDLLFSRAA